MNKIHIVSSENNSIFYNSYIKCIEQGVFRIEHITVSRYYVVNLEKYEIVFKLLASNCMKMYETVIRLPLQIKPCTYNKHSFNHVDQKRLGS